MRERILEMRMELIRKNLFSFIYAGKLDESKGGLLSAEVIKDKIECKRD